MRSMAILAAGVVVGGVVGSFVTARTNGSRRAESSSMANSDPTTVATRTTFLRVAGMTCETCVPMVKSAAMKLDGVLEASVSFAHARAEVTYDPAKTTPDLIAAAITERSGFKATAGDIPASSSHPGALSAMAVADLRNAFNASSDRTRVVAILSPTCSECIAGQGVIAKTFATIGSDQLRGFIVWLSMRGGDNEQAAGRQSDAFTDARVQQAWDNAGGIGDAFSRTLSLKGRAWDVYAVYAPGVRWTESAPPTPTFWMHQLTSAAGADQQLCLVPTTFVRRVEEIVKGHRPSAE